MCDEAKNNFHLFMCSKFMIIISSSYNFLALNDEFSHHRREEENKKEIALVWNGVVEIVGKGRRKSAINMK